MKIAKNNSGLSLFELTLIIIVLSVVAALALPKFMATNNHSHDANAQRAFTAFTAAINLYHSCWLSAGQQTAITNLACFGDGNLDSNNIGFPLGIDVNTNASMQPQNCRQLWQHLMTNSFVLQPLAEYNPDAQSRVDITYGLAGSNAHAAKTYCFYQYVADMRLGSNNWQLHYYPGSGKTLVSSAIL